MASTKGVTLLYCQPTPVLRSLTLDAYQVRARRADQNRHLGAEGLRIPLLGLFGEVGSLLTQPKRRQREKATFASYTDAMTEEFGDVLWYLSNLASRHRIPLSALAQAKGDSDNLRIGLEASPSLTFRQLERRSPGRPKGAAQRFQDSDFFALGGTVGRLMSEFAAGEHWELDRGEFLRHLARTFRLLIRAAQSEKISLGFAAENNLAKIESRWPQKTIFLPLFDAKCDKDEQLPRRIEMHFVEKKVNRTTYVLQSCRGINIGDRLTDNKGKEDDYRFHDVFHLAYAAILGWSPVMRALFRVKRKSMPSVDENQDGARAILIEEGIATWIFNHGIEHKDFRFTTKLDYSLLKAIRHLVSGYEVDACTLWQWELAILEGFKVFRMLKKERTGWIIADMNNRSISFRKTPPRTHK